MVKTAFASVDRPEDRPHTLAWIISQAIAAYLVLVAVFVGFDNYRKKLKRLSKLIRSLEKNPSQAVQIELDYNNKAVIKKKKM